MNNNMTTERIKTERPSSSAVTKSDGQHWVIAGAGAIGIWIGAHLVAGGQKVTFLARPKVISNIQQHGVLLTSWAGEETQLSALQMQMTEDESCLADADVIVVAVKSKDTFAMAEQISRHIKPHARVISAQNGINNASALSNILPDHPVASMMVPYNVLPMDAGRYHCGTQGHLVIDRIFTDLAKVIRSSGLEIQTADDMHEILWGKLLLNLNNPLNALSGVPLVEELSDKRWRKQLADCIDETLTILDELGIQPKVQAPIPASWLPAILKLPTFIFKRVAKKMLQMDPLARSSMQEDIMLGRPTEIDYINGEVVRYARSLGMNAPFNEMVISQIKRLEQTAQSAC
ncbi:2-dehydropantoate 2-reductase [Litoribrevibacter albus]|uniref:2-dehydropantoate 2-reductase n=1 Tax=Litoribrevibacter albus TaxID=1473156 RepID=A0AA37W655_9GAMM|nr:2-dehydropantoate 2-reductase [Litoribrevibacter albus]GLQ31270.1 2-dehydropantoate 2-reductase [Litoribrevibacter albus]